MTRTASEGTPIRPARRATVLLLSTADTDLLAARASGVGYRTANPARTGPDQVPALLAGVDVVVVRLLGGRAGWPEGLATVLAAGLPTVVLGGEATPDAELMALSTVPAGTAAQALAYLLNGGPDNLAELANFLSDTLTYTGIGFAPPRPTPTHGIRRRPGTDPGRPTVGIVYYRAHELSGNTGFVDALAGAVEAAGANARPVYCATLRGLRASAATDAAGGDGTGGLLDALRGCDALVVTTLAAGGSVAADASAGGDEDAWDVGALAALDVPVLQALCLTTDRATWLASDAALTPMDAAMQVAIPEFDGRLITVPFSFKETDADGVPVYVADPERCTRVAGIAVGQATLRHTPPAERRLALVLSSYPTKHSRVGNAVGLDTPASAVRLLAALAAAGYDVGDPPDDGDELIHTLIAAGGHDVEWLTEEQLAAAGSRVPLAAYRRWFDALPAALRTRMLQHWGEPPGGLYVDGDEIVLASLRFGNVVLMIQPPRGFGENPVAIYHDPDLPPSHHYLAAYRWLAADVADGGFGAHAIVHLGKHGTLEWLPGKGLGLSAGCAPDAVLGDLPVVYPFIVNDPGEGTQAKRRAHAVVVDHLIPPMARADSYGDLAKLEQLLDEYATVAALDPAKLPTVRAQIWDLVRVAQLHHDLHAEDEPDAGEFDDFVLHLDGYLCEVKDVQIRDGLHVLGRAPAGDELVEDVLAILRAAQVWGGRTGALPGLRAALARVFGLVEAELLAEPGRLVEVPVELVDAAEALAAAARDDAAALATGVDPQRRAAWLAAGRRLRASEVVDHLHDIARAMLAELAEPAGDAGPWDPDAVDGVVAGLPDGDEPATAVLRAVLRFACTEVVPRLRRTTDEIDNVLAALDGRFVPPGPSGSPTRGLVGTLPTGRNFYSVDPKAIPSVNAWAVGRALADSLLARYLADTGEYPASVGLTVWGTSAMRTQGDDIAEVLALLGCRPVWDSRSRRVTGIELIPLAELGRPRIDVTVRISGFFRDAFPHVVAMLDDAVRLVAGADEPAADNHVAAHVAADLAGHGDLRRATTRIFGSKPGAYGAGLLPLIDARTWRTDADLAEVYAVWGGYAYGRDLDGREARGDMELAFRRIAVAVKNADTREHDIADSDDYFQYHGGMVAAVRHLTGASPAAYVGDSAVPDSVRTRTLAEETRRVFRARVVNPRWIAAMRRHGYKGGFELAATVDYLFGFDATAQVVDDWMYERLTESYVDDPEVREFLRRANPWALRGITERLLEAADRGMWAQPEPGTLDRLRAAYLETEGDLEAGGEGQ